MKLLRFKFGIFHTKSINYKDFIAKISEIEIPDNHKSNMLSNFITNENIKT